MAGSTIDDDRAALQAILDTSVLAITHFRRDGTILMINATGARNLGGVPSELVGRNVFDLLPELADQTRERIARAFEGGDFAVETGVRLPGGERWFRSTYRPIRDADGAPLSVELVSQDVTELKRVEQVLEATEGRLASVLEHAPHIVVLLDLAGVVRYVNRVPEGYTVEQVVGSPGVDHLFPDSAEQLLRSFARVRETGTPDLIEVEDRTGRSWEVRLAPVVRRGKIHQFIAFVVEVTERKRAREREALVQHAQKLESLGVLAGGIAHDFNNLLVGILGNAELLSRRTTDPVDRARLENVVRAATSAAGLCRQMLAYAGRGEVAPEGVDLSRLAAETLDLVRTSISTHARLVCTCPEGLPLVEGDPSQLRQVVMNLLTNASDAFDGRDGSIALTCGVADVDPEHEGRRVYVEVRDTGRGMDAETRRRMFEPFFTTKQLGSGLGLSAVLGIVQGHRGALHVESEPGQGTTIRVSFPEAAPGVRAGRTESRSSLPVRTGRILVVDDEPGVRTVAGEILKSSGHRVSLAAGGAEALERYDADPLGIDGVLLDVTMPGLDGREVLAELRRRSPALPIVLTSGFLPSPDERAQWACDPATRFLAKPYSLDTLVEAFEDLLAARSARGRATG